MSLKDSFTLTAKKDKYVPCNIITYQEFYGYVFDVERDTLEVTMFFFCPKDGTFLA